MEVHVMEVERQRRRTWAAVALLAALALLLVVFLPYASGYGSRRVSLFASLRNLWGYPDWQHAALAPLIVGVLLAWDRKRIFRGPAAGSWWGLGLLAAGFFAYWAGFKTNVYYFGFGAVQILLAGGVVWLAGWCAFRRVFFHWCFFAFTWPLFFLTDVLAFRMRLVMIECSSAFLSFAGIGNVRSGTAILSPANLEAGLEQGARFALDIADPCSGIRSLFALMMVAALWGFLRLPKVWQRFVLVACAVPLAILGNFVRVVLLVGASIGFGPEFAVGEPGDPSAFHFLAGIAVFVVALGGMVFAGQFMQAGLRVFRRGRVVRSVSGGAAAETRI